MRTVSVVRGPSRSRLHRAGPGSRRGRWSIMLRHRRSGYIGNVGRKPANVRCAQFAIIRPVRPDARERHTAAGHALQIPAALASVHEHLGEGGAPSDEAGVPGRRNQQAPSIRLVGGRDQSGARQAAQPRLQCRCTEREVAHRHHRVPDTAACEGFFGRLKTEMFFFRDWLSTTIEAFVAALDAYIRRYNEARIKISLGGLSPTAHRRSLGVAV